MPAKKKSADPLEGKVVIDTLTLVRINTDEVLDATVSGSVGPVLSKVNGTAEPDSVPILTAPPVL